MRRHDTDRTTDRTTDRRVTVLEAAELLNLTPDAVRARLRRGTLRKERGKDGTLYVVLDSETTDTTATGRPTEQPTVALLDAKDQTISHLSEQLEFLRQQLQEEREESRRKDHLLAAALERIPAIEPPPDTASQEPHESPEPTSESPTESREWAQGHEGETYGTPAEEAEESLHRNRKRSWWRAFFGLE